MSTFDLIFFLFSNLSSLQVFPECRVINAYGPTEATAVTVHHLSRKGFQFVVIGRPDTNVHAYVVDSQLRPVPVGVPGELLLSGPRLALGYIGQPELTDEKFIPNPCSDLISKRVNSSLAPYYEKAYRTGDLVRWRGDGTIEFLGRIDRQVKITGVRIELGEVESAIENMPEVGQAIAAAVPNPEGQKRLVGYVTPETVDPAAVIAHCRARLIAAMVPSMVVPLGTFPLMPNGKVDVRALPAPDWSARVNMAGIFENFEDDGPLDVHAEAVLAIIRETLGLDAAERIPLKAELFAIGASSIQVAAIAGKIRKQLEVNLDMREVYQDPRVDFLVEKVRSQKGTTEEDGTLLMIHY